jgi:hypothetical protein
MLFQVPFTKLESHAACDLKVQRNEVSAVKLHFDVAPLKNEAMYVNWVPNIYYTNTTICNCHA